MKPVLVLVHGWGFDRNFWTPLQDALGNLPCLAWDLGYFGEPSQPLPPEGRAVVAVGHSFGLLWLLRHRPVAWSALVSINGFTRFVQGDGFADGKPKRMVAPMKAGLAQDPVALVGEFRAHCGEDGPTPAGPLNCNALRTDLRAMVSWDERANAVVNLALAGNSDPIVTPTHAAACFPASRTAWHSGGHLLPTQDPAWCASRLVALTECMA
jgi:pimeloyl-[acyl-carrier protein] methyl ester esterase